MSSDKDHPSLDDPNAWVPYRYVPSNVAAIIFVVSFTLVTVSHVLRLAKKKTWYFIPLVVGGLMEAIGYVGRIISHQDVWALGPFIMQSLLILIAPALFAASIYIILGRIILMVDGECYCLVRLKWLTKMFVAGDVLSFLLQGAGGGIQAMGTLSSLHAGEKIIIGGLFVQLGFFAFFIVVAAMFHYRFVNDKPLRRHINRSAHFGNGRKHRQLASTSSAAATATLSHAEIDTLPWKRHLYNLYIASTLIIVRSVFRVIEYLQGNSGYLLSHEVFLYLFDALLMLAVMVLFIGVHPSEITDSYQKRHVDISASELQRVRDGYMVQDGEAGNANKFSGTVRSNGA